MIENPSAYSIDSKGCPGVVMIWYETIIEYWNKKNIQYL